MIDTVLDRLSRHQREKLLAEEARKRRIGDWGDWRSETFPRGSAGPGWAADFTNAAVNNVFSVLIRTLGIGAGQTTHLAVSSLSGIRPTFGEMQRIKNELAGPEHTAVEVYPPQSELIDDAPMFHIWVVNPLPFTLAERNYA